MEPLDLRLAPPRGPRAACAGIVFTGRVIDKLRASLPGGELNGYLPFTGFSTAWAHYTGIDLNEMQRVVAGSSSEADIEAWIRERTAHADTAKINAKLERFETARISENIREQFEQTYPLDLRMRYALLFDLFEADDARLYGRET